MPTIPLHLSPHLHTVGCPGPTTTNRTVSLGTPNNPLPSLLQTPAGLAILEIQGKINVSGATSGNAVSLVGNLVFPHYGSNDVTGSQSWMKTVYLYVGKHQRLTGEVKRLPKAIGVMKHRNAGMHDVDASTRGEEDLEIVDIVEWKILFSNRPEPVGD